ncbi:hypothetical protein C1I98_17115 [Spongiactinospora gelatinilytica]|uniref:Uncharacterized protein n=1 Tax=Spongiactinospora gelatinilytica TaxID=2666298 RepID=A0A2W2H4R7_9ACTN|nr:hypothetical protein [Spongiactinospora gelatinilytica]PZG44518.1 hypothetical protein C1I98_17115 [Spongiactinospora gelatinilytica]
MGDIDTERLRSAMRGLADQAHPSDLSGRVRATSRRRRTRRIATIAAGCAAALAVAAGSLSALSPPRADDKAVPIMTPPDPGPHVPPTRQAGGREIMSLVLPDRTRVDISYPAELRLAGMGWSARRTPSGGDDGSCCFATVRLHDSARRVGTAKDAKGHVLPIWTAKDGSDGESDSVSSYAQVGRWYLHLADEPPRNASGWKTLRQLVGDLVLEETAEGFLVIDGRKPGFLARNDSAQGDVWAQGPKLESDPAKAAGQVRGIEVQRVDRCAPVGKVGMELTGRQICRDGVAVRFVATKTDQNWVGQVHKGLRIERVY